MTQQQKRGNTGKGKPQLFLLPVQLPLISDKEVFEKLLRTVDTEMIFTGEKPSEIIKKTLNELDAYQVYMLYVKISDSRKNIELLKDVADRKICPTIGEKTEKLINMSVKNPPAELIGRVFATIQFINYSHQIKWLSEFNNHLNEQKNYKQLISLAMKIAFFAPAQAINYIKSLEYFFKNKKIEEILK